MKLTLAILLLPAMASLPYAAGRVGSKNMKLNSLEPLKVRLAPLPTDKDTEEEHRIIGGDVAELGEFPFYVNWNDNGLFCGGSLINEDIILTAAHCSIISTDEIHIGTYYLDSLVADEEIQSIETRSVHPDYDEETLVNDVMVLKIVSPSLLLPVALNDDTASPSVGEDVVTIGLGIADDGDVSDVLRKVTVPIVAHDQCAADYVDVNLIVEDVMLCAGLEEGGKDSCSGDSGGPLLELRDGEYVQVGITSWGENCALPNFPGVYTRVSGVKSWIDAMICELSDNPPASCESTSGTSSSTPSPSNCEDSSEEFFADEDAGNRDCAWLATNQERYEYLCSFVDVAFACPVTCDICDRLPV